MADMSYAILIDGGFVKYTLKQKRSDAPIDAALLKAFIDSIVALPQLVGLRLHRVYFYDAKPLTKKVTRPDGTVIDFANSKAHAISVRQHQTISRLPFVAMRFGELSDRGWKVPERLLRNQKNSVTMTIQTCDLEPNVQQKGVDMRIGLDVAALTIKRQSGMVVLVTGDSDLVPAMKLARREGAQVILITLGQKLKEAMYDHADVVIEDKAWIAYQSVIPAAD
ncbi:MAG: NYN domain-containing protein [Xanthomonadales bacterium]|nr:NYN domain-containing protein [Xanthomonadales bacterium]